MRKLVLGGARLALVTGAITTLAGCAFTAPLDADRTSRLLADHIPVWAGGEPDSLRSTQMPHPSLGIFDNPPTRPIKPLDAEDQNKLRADLVALRNRTFARGKAAQTVDAPGVPMRSADHHDEPPGAAASAAGAASRPAVDGPS